VRRGGVIGLAPFGPLVMKPGQTSWPSLGHFLDHVDHVVQLTGTMASIGMGTDMSLGTCEIHPPDPWGDAGYPDIGAVYAEHVSGDRRSPQRALPDFNSYAHVWRLIDALQRRGYADDDVAAFLGGNYLSLFERVWR
jgi:membrane dipeptidase